MSWLIILVMFWKHPLWSVLKVTIDKRKKKIRKKNAQAFCEFDKSDLLWTQKIILICD